MSLRRLCDVNGQSDSSDEDPAEVERAWQEEIQRRVAAIERGEAEWISHDEVMRRLSKVRTGNGLPS